MTDQINKWNDLFGAGVVIATWEAMQWLTREGYTWILIPLYAVALISFALRGRKRAFDDGPTREDGQ